jgi:class 3 adenylate cyclase
VAAPGRVPEGERKQVTVLFADVVRSMELAERFEADEWTEIITGLFTVAAEAVERFGGTVDKFTGDGLMALFGAPVAQEDHAARACRAALALTAAATAYGAELRARRGVDLAVRVGLNSGEVVAGAVGGSGFTAVGHTVGLAQRMESRTEPGEIGISEHTAALIGQEFLLRDLGKVTVKGASRPIGMFAVESGPSAAAAPGRRRTGSARMVGRDVEWRLLEDALATRDGTHVFGVVAEPGAGKSRLCDELAGRALELGLEVHRAAGVSHATSIPLLPIRALLRDRFAIAGTDSPAQTRDQVGRRLLGLDPGLADELPVVFDFLEVPDDSGPRVQLSPDARRARILEVLRRAGHLHRAAAGALLILEDLHWFDPQSVAFLTDWLPALAGTGSLVVLNFRPEFHPDWAGEPFYRHLPLAALDPGSVGELLAGLVGSDASLSTLTADLAERAGGNPFFIEEIVRAWSEDGTLRGQPGAYLLARPVETIHIPPTVQTVLAGRIDRVATRDKAVLQAAAVIGRTFTTQVLAAVAATDSDELAEALSELCAAELLIRTGEDHYRFWHPLTQEVVYRSLLGSTRRRLHRSTAHALLAAAPQRQDELAALIAAHFANSGEELEAGRWHLRAALRGLTRDAAEAQRLLRAAVAHLDAAPPSEEGAAMGLRARTTLIRSRFRGAVDVAEADTLIGQADALAHSLGRADLLAEFSTAAGVAAFAVGEHRRGLALWQEGARFADQVAGPEQRAARAFSRVGLPLIYGTVGPLSTGLAEAAAMREICGGDSTLGVALTGFSALDVLRPREAVLHLRGGRLPEARRLFEDSVAAFELRPADEWKAWTLANFAELQELSGDPADLPAAERAVAEAVRLGSDTGSMTPQLLARAAHGLMVLLADRPVEAVELLSGTLELMRRHQLIWEESSIHAHLARAHLAVSDVTSARAAADEAVDTSVRHGARVLECRARAVRARVMCATASSAADLAEVRTEISLGEAAVAETGAFSWAPVLAEERARLDGGDLSAVAVAYDAIGASGHAARLRADECGWLSR